MAKKENVFTKILHTGGDVLANVGIGLGKGIEGIVDLGAGIGGAVAGVFDDEAQEKVKDFVARDLTGELYGNAWQEGLDQSYLNDSTVGRIVEGTAQGLGQMLPAVAVSIVTGGAAAPALLTTMASAAGTGTEEAFQEGAGYGQGMAYGAASGAIEGATEKLLPGLGGLYGDGIKIGKRAAKEVAEEVAEVGIKRVAKEALGEGVEEMISEVANPGLKTIYKGKDALAEYGEADFWKGVGEAGVIGMGTSFAYGGLSKVTPKLKENTGTYADAKSVMDHVADQQGLIDNGDLSVKDEVQAQKNIKADYDLLSERLVKAKPSVRERVLKNPQLAAAFNADGTVKADFAAWMDGKIQAAGDTSHGLDRRYYSATARGREAEIIDGLAAQGTRVFSGELSTEEGAAYQKAKQIHVKLKEMGFVNTDLVLSETMPDANAYLDGNTVVIGKDTLADGSYVKHLVHETTHFTEGTQEWVDVMDHVFGKDAEGVKSLMERVKTSGYGVTDADVDTVVKAVQDGTLKDTKTLTKAQKTLVSEVVAMQMEEIFGSEQAVSRLVRQKPNLAKRIFAGVKAILQTFGKTDEQKAEIQKLRHTEQLFRRALQNAGVGYAVEELRRTAAENMQVSGENDAEIDAQNLDDGAEVRYNDDKVQRSAKIVKYIPYSKVGQGNVDAIRRQLSRLYGGVGNSVANGVAIENGSTVFIVDSGKENGEIRFGVRGKIKISDSNLRAEYIRRTNVEAVSNGCVSDGLSSRFGDRYDNHRQSNLRRESGTEPSVDQGKSSNNKGGVSVRNANRGEIKQSRKQSGDTVTISKGEMAKLHANYAGDKVFAKKSVADALASIDAFQKLPTKIREDFVNSIWRGYNVRLNQQGFDLFTELAWHQLHATIMQEVGYDELGTMTEEAYAEAERKMDEQIVAALHRIVDSGKPSIKARLESDTSTEGYRKKADFWREEHSRTVERNKLLGEAKFEVEKLANAKMGRYVNAANYRGDTFRVALSELARMNWRGGLVRDAKIRERFAALDAWYCKDNPLYEGDGGGNELFRQDIKDALSALGNAQNGVLTNDDLRAAQTVIKYFAHEVEAHNTIYKDGKRVDAMPEAKRYVEGVAKAKEIAVKCGIWQRLTRSGFARMVADPAMLMRQADGYLKGFFTEQFEQLRQGTIDAAVMERELSENFEKFWEEHKSYGKRYNNATVTFGGKEMPLQEAISLYMTMHREQAFAGLAGAGFEIDGKDARENISDGFADEVEKIKTEEYKKLPPEEVLTLTKEGHARIEQVALEKALKEQREALEKQFTDEDRALISIMEKIFEQCREVKVKIDEIVQGYSNVTGGYYFPIKRTGLAENVDAWTGFEGDRVSNLSINKDTVKNAHKLYIEPVHIVFMRHLKAISLYHGLGVFTDNFNRLYNLNVNGPQIKNAAQSAAAQAYAKAEVNRDIINLVEKVKQGQHKANDFVDLGAVSSEAAAKIEKVTGKDFTGYKIAVEARQIEHIINDHGKNGKSDHSMASDSDIAKMLYAITTPDLVSDGGTTRAYFYMKDGKNRPAKTVLYEKSVGEKSYYAVQTAIDTKKKTLHIVSAFIGKSGYKKGAPQLTSAQGLGATSKNAIVGTPTNRIPQNSENVNLGEQKNNGNPLTVRDAIGRSNNYAKEMLTYFKELKQDVEGISKKRNSEKFYNDAVAYIRSAYATYQLGFNPKVWVTQLSSMLASGNILDADCLVKGLRVSGKDVDKYCRLAWLRDNDNSAAMAQAVETPQNAVQRAGRNVLRVVRDSSMVLIGKVDRIVVKRLFGACQVQVEKEGGAKVGTEENKIAAGQLLQRVILETQQNSLATERSAAMRSGDEFAKGFTMFSADAMKVGARLIDAFGELSALKTLRKEAKAAGNTAEAERLNKEIKRAIKQCRRSVTALVGVAVFNALIAYGFKWLYRRDEEENVGTFIADTFGNMLGGIPFIRDFYSYFQDGFEMDHFLISTLNDVLGTAAASYELVRDAASGKEVTRQQALANMRKVFYAAGQLSGVPVRNVYNVTTGMINRVTPEVGYKAEALFVAKAYSSDLQKAMDAGDEDMVATIAGLMLDEKAGYEDDTARKALRELTAKGHSVLPRSVGDSVTVDGEKISLSGAQQKKFREIYQIGGEAVSELVRLKQFTSADEKVQAKAIQFIYDVYWDLALEGATGIDLAEKNVLFAEAISIEKLAVIIATARAIEADKDKNGKSISGTKKRKIQTFVNSLQLTAAQKYMVMGYLGYTNANGEQAVKGYISRLNLSKSEKTALLRYSGYGA